MTAAIVTYGARARFCRESVRSALACGAGAVVLVDNGTVAPTTKELESIAADPRVRLVRSTRNGGSAGGYALAIESALERAETQRVWLLDDDNRPDPAALDELMVAARDTDTDTIALSYRRDRPYQRAIVEQGRAPARAFPRRSAFASFHVADVPAKLAAFAGRSRGGSTGGRTPVQIPYGPYSGALVPRAVIERVGGPDTALYVYEDDADFFMRCRESGARLLLVPSSRLEDMDDSWYHASARRGPFAAILLEASDGRVFYTMRNRVAFERRHWIDSAPVYRLNRAVFRAGLWLTALVLREGPRLRLVDRAIRDGDARRLGVAPGVDL